VIESGMNKRAGNDANQPVSASWKNPEIEKIQAISNLVYKYKPDEKKNNGRWDEAEDEPLIFNVGFFGQVNRYSVFGIRWSVTGDR
jgi:hypothetical protein